MTIPSRNQRVWNGFTANIAGGEVDVSRTFRLVAGRARQLIHLKGYRLGYNYRYVSPANVDQTRILVALQAIDRDWSLGAVAWLNNGPKATTIDFIFDASQVHQLSTTGAAEFTTRNVAGWIPCDLVVPELAIYNTHVLEDEMRISFWCVAEFEWIDATPDEIAAVNFMWGRDPQDFDRS